MDESQKKLNIDWEKDGPKPPDVSLNPWVLEHKKAISNSRSRDVVVALFFLVLVLLTFFGFYYGIIAVAIYGLVISIDIIVKRKVILKTGLAGYGKNRYVDGAKAIVSGVLYLFLWLVIIAVAAFAILRSDAKFQINIKTIAFILISIIVGIIMGMYSNKSRAIKFENRLM